MYKLSNQNIVIKNDIAFIPMVDENQDYQEYLAWLSEGNTPEPADPIPVTYQPLTAWQIRKVLNAHGLREAVEAAVAQSDQNTKDAWEFATEYQRDNPILNALATGLGLTAEQLDAMFVEALTL